MRVSGEGLIDPGRTRASADIEEVRLVGGEITLEGRESAAAAVAAGLRVRWLDFAGAEAQAAIAAQGAGSVRLPLVIVDGTHTLQRPQFAAVTACIAALRRGDAELPAGVVALAGYDRARGRAECSIREACPLTREPVRRLAA
jgi:hypothetical protein